MELTKLEKAFLNEMRETESGDLLCSTCVYCEDCIAESGDDTIGSNSAEYLHILEGYFDSSLLKNNKTFSGIVSSLIQKGLIDSDEHDNETYFISFTDEILDVFKEEEGRCPTEYCKIPFLK